MRESLSNINKVGRFIFFVLLCLFFLSVIIQFFLAGMAVFVSPANWMKHTFFVHLFGFNIPVLLLLFAFVGRLPNWAYWGIFGLFITVFGMYITANVNPLLGAIHPIVGIVMILISYHLLKKNVELIFLK
ncbi:DUF6220 domain-containing protein, partial [Piscibacillus halophilus]|uniref:DUF6220 domain-containing protein n=1 Tax=Piscibacillus halophilus TaxID=571933 RepID=UPI00158C052D